MKLIIEIDDDIAKGIRGENECEVEPRAIVRSFQATIADAIENGTPYNPKGDCISRDALKKCAIPCKIHNGALTDLCVPLYQIDNAPTVETFTLEDMQNNYDAGVDSVIGKYDKAKGEWVEFEYETSGGYKCSNCENIEVYTPNFCPNCGADMRGGAE